MLRDELINSAIQSSLSDIYDIIKEGFDEGKNLITHKVNPNISDQIISQLKSDGYSVTLLGGDLLSISW